MTFTRVASSKPVTPEKAVQNAVIKMLQFHGWMVVRNQQGMGTGGSSKGRPDLEAYRNGFVMFVEVKAPRHLMKTGKLSPGGKLSDDQEKYIARLKDQDMTVLVVDDAEKFLVQLEQIQERLWPGKGIRRIC